MKRISLASVVLVALAAPLAAFAAPPQTDEAASAQLAAPASEASSALVEKVRAATARFKNINVAIKAGFVQGTPCVSGPDFGAMGVHFILPARVNMGVLKAEQPEALIYEPQANGSFRLVGVEYIVLSSIWTGQHSGEGPPALDGNLLNYVPDPNRYGLPAFYEMHVWAWEQNPVGSYADWNTHVTCTHQQAD